MEERKRRFQDKEDVFPAIRERVQKSFAPGLFEGIHVFTPSADVPDDCGLRLVVLPPDAAFSRTGQNLALDRAGEILKARGEQPRQKQNRLLFLAADYDSVSRLKDQVRSLLAWQSILADIKDLRLNLDQIQARQASKSADDAAEALRRMIREAYRWLLAPMQEAKPGKGISAVQWEHFPVNPSAQNLTQEIERVIRDNELVIGEWAPVHLANVLKTWFWKEDLREVSALEVWQKMGYYLYLPRLQDDHVYKRTLGAGAGSRDFFGLAYGREGDTYVGFSFGKPTAPILDASLLLLEPVTAAAYAEAQRLRDETNRKEPGKPEKPEGNGKGIREPQRPDYDGTGGATTQLVKKRFYGTVELDPFVAKKQFADIVDEVVMQFTAHTGVEVEISVEIRAKSSAGFDEGLQRAVKLNCGILKFKGAEFEGSDR
jgi:hypothetical protein